MLQIAIPLLAFAAVPFAQIEPILVRACLPCHDEAKGAGGVRFHTRAAAAKNLNPSLLRVIGMDPNQPGAMPPGGAQLPAAERALIGTWMAEGAPWPADRVLRMPAKAGQDDLGLTALIRRKVMAQRASTAGKGYLQTIPGADAAFEMLPIPAGKFTMGSSEKDERPQRELKVEAFWMQKHEVTWDEYRLFMFANDTEKAAKDAMVDGVSRPTKPYVEMSFGMGLNGFPAISMTHHAANKYAQWLSAKTGHFYRLPTEAEWEYACRADSPPPVDLKAAAWFASNTDGKYELVGKKQPNAWGLHDMLGNVMEWTLDGHAPYKRTQTAASDWAPSTGPYPHVARGGGWTDTAKRLTCSARFASDPSWKMQDPQIPKSIWYMTDAQSLGFRLVRPVRVPSVSIMHRAWNNGVENE